MGIFKKIFDKKSKNEQIDKDINNSLSKNYEHFVYKFIDEFNLLLKEDKYIARSDYKYLIEKYKNDYNTVKSLINSKMDKEYCKQNSIDIEDFYRFQKYYIDIMNLKIESVNVSKHNEEFINKHLESDKEFLDNVLKEVDPNIVLDEEQRRVVLSDEDNTLVIAGAGAGKTTTVAAKVSYLVNIKNVNPRNILVVSFTNKAVNELKERIKESLGFKDCVITTFHSTGNAIIKKKEDEKLKIVGEGFLYNVINDYINKNILSNVNNVDKILLFFASYFNAPNLGGNLDLYFKELAYADFSTLKSNLNEFNEQVIDKKLHLIKTINNEIVRSYEEVRIANFLYLNGIDYKYEEVYPYHILDARKPYTPDFTLRQDDKVVYLEHFGLSESLKNSLYSESQIEKYKKQISNKIELHKKHGTKLIYTFSSYNDKLSIEDHLKELLISAGLELNKRDSNEIYKKIVSNETNKYTFKFIKFICRFINNFKANNYRVDKFDEFIMSTKSARNKLFLDIAKECYLEYERVLKENHAVDFADMINYSADIIKNKQIDKEKLDFKYIIVDEYQDISRQRFDLTTELSKICDAKIIAVGDDWQSIYAFSGSDISLFTHFSDNMGYAKELSITKTYRNSQELIDIAGNFIQKNTEQIRKRLVSPKNIVKPVLIYSYETGKYNKDTKKRENDLGKKVTEILGYIIQANKVEKKNLNSNVLIMGRYNFDAANLCMYEDFVMDNKSNKVICSKYPFMKLEFMTAHSSKGLGYDNVILINAANDTLGFPSKIENDPLLDYVVKKDESYVYAEERRLFYVALTRTKNRVYIVCPKNKPSEFVTELIDEYSAVTLKDEINRNYVEDKIKNKCPICGYPLQLRFNKNYGYKLFMCTNDSEVCGFISNDLRGGSLQIQKCDKCKDGYLLVKINKSKDNAFLGCSNYRADGLGCDRIITNSENSIIKLGSFEVDDSINKKSYIDLKDYSVEDINKVKEKVIDNIVKSPEPKKEETKRYNQVKTLEQKIMDEGFKLISDNNGKILTDVDLLKRLRSLRYNISLRDNIKPFMVFSNDVLVSLATYKPVTKVEFIGIYGLGERKYEQFGKEIIEEIKKETKE